MAKYTMSADGKMRTSVIVRTRYTQQEMQEYNAKAKALGFKDLRNYLDIQLRNADMRLLEQYEAEDMGL